MSTRAVRPLPVPTATYRVQLQPDHPFAAVVEDVPHLADLGVSHLHLSPVLEAVPGSAHGYDVVDHSRVRRELGGEDGLRELSAVAGRHGLGLVVDVVPNHMAFPVPARLNRALWLLLRDGPEAETAHWFDVDWAAGDGRLLVPVLADRLGRETAAMRVADGELAYGPHRFPLRPGTETLPLPDLLDAQHYRLAWWRLGRTELNYRRFFSVSDLIAVRVEDPEVFAATHGLLLDLLAEGVVHGLRVDHPDGLADPGAYLRRLAEHTGGAWTVVEKILAPAERLPAAWPVAGTTGYDALHRLDGLFTDPEGHARLADHYREFTGAADDLGGRWRPTELRAAHEMLRGELAAELSRLVRAGLARRDADPRLRHLDLTPTALRAATTALLVRLPIYRTYPPPDTGDGARLLARAAHEARSALRLPDEAEAVDVVLRLLDEEGEFATRLAQLSGALRAKSAEDTAFYRYAPLLSATEVGGDPDRPAVGLAEFHEYCTRQRRDRPHGQTVLTTHDTKRSGDVRAALAVLTECPDRWRRLLAEVAGTPAGPDAAATAPDPHTVWTGWQTAYGLGVPDRDRLAGALLKAAREAKLHTTWTEPDTLHEEMIERFVDKSLCGQGFDEVTALAEELAPHVRAGALGRQLLHLTMPGVPDLYQGTEDAYRALVDPDNRAPHRVRPAGDPPGERRALTRTALRLRRERPEWFDERGDYRPLYADGPGAEHCVAFTRAGAVVSVATRLSLRLAEAGGWRDTTLTLPDGRWTDLLVTEEPVPELAGSVTLAELTRRAPVALLVRR
ncbi:malto-oligosyltrehalose synthase [Streptomyces alkaliterrae]|uniref:malto-oligosyltrehalose synthase n=1 Tax=Streptomyces alkaliterrae TaxID=2213162 RepID=UPI002B209355|nr:malto-oligosyltrehalose synthase [Streptomyces alkaliterrae]